MRCPFFTPSDEVTHEAEALTIAASFFPEQGEHSRFFVDAARRIFAHLLSLRPTPEELISWMCHPDEIDRILAGTELAIMIDRQAGPQRAGVLGSLNMAGSAPKLLPREKDTVQRWSTVEWAKQRKGWIFITSTPTAQEQLQPLVSMWLDLLMLRLMNDGHTTKMPAWFVLDEAADLKHLPQLTKALTQSRKSNSPIVLGFQGIDQVNMFYRGLGKTILSQPSTRIYLKTGEPDAAKWISNAIGEVQIERLRETQSVAGGKRSFSEVIDPPRPEPLVPYSKMLGLSRLQGYMKCGNLVVELSTRYIDIPKRCEGLIQRPVEVRSSDKNERAKGPAEPPINRDNLFFE
jgi:hypothetical protein